MCHGVHQKYFLLEPIYSNKALLLQSILYISLQLIAKVIFTCRRDLTVVSSDLFLSLVHCAETSESISSINALLTGMENTIFISLYRRERKLFFVNIFIQLASAPSFVKPSFRTFSVHISSKSSTINSISKKCCFANSLALSYSIFLFFSMIQLMCIG